MSQNQMQLFVIRWICYELTLVGKFLKISERRA